MGTFNDNFYKQAGLLLAVHAGNAGFQSWATFLFALPFVVFSAAAGWLADRYAKKRLIVWAKVIEVVAAAVGMWAIVAESWAGMLFMVCAMGCNSTLFSPALNGSIPELYEARDVPRINALFKLTTTVSILLGVALAGVALDQKWWSTSWDFGRGLVGTVAIGVAVLGLFSTLFIPARPGLGSTAPFPKAALWDSFRHLKELKSDPALHLVLWAEPFFYFLSTLLLLEINRLGVESLGYSFSLTSMLSVALMLGVCAGSLLAARGTPESWRTLMLPALGGIALSLCAAGLVEMLPRALQLPWLLLTYGLAGGCGGLYLIPLTSFMQVRPAPEEKGKVLAIANCLSFSGILLAGQLAYGLSGLDPALCHVLMAVGTLATALYFALRLNRLRGGRATLTARCLLTLMRPLLALRYRIEVQGQEVLENREGEENRPLLILPSHSALVDPLILFRLLGRHCPRPLGDSRRTGSWLIRAMLAPFRPIRIPDMAVDGRQGAQAARAALNLCAKTLQEGDNVLIYPTGQLTRDGFDHVGNHKGGYFLYTNAPGCRVIVARVRGLWGSSFSYAEGNTPYFMPAFKAGLRKLLANLIFFMPRRRVSVTFAEFTPEPDMSPQAFNAALEAFYQAEAQPLVKVPYYFWERATA